MTTYVVFYDICRVKPITYTKAALRVLRRMPRPTTIPRDEYRRLLEAAETLEDIRAYDRAVAELEAGREELVPAAFAERLVAGESPVRVFREWRGLSQAELARRSGVNRIQLIDIEAGRAGGSVETLRKLAEALGVMLDDLA